MGMEVNLSPERRGWSEDAPPGSVCPAGSGQTRSRTAAPGTTCWVCCLWKGPGRPRGGLGSAAPRRGPQAGLGLRKSREKGPATPGRFAGRFVNTAKYELEVPIAYSLLTQINQ